MAKKARGGVNKSQLIRDYMAAHPEAGPQAVVEGVKSEHGVEVTAQFVSTIKSNDRRKAGAPAGRRGRRGRRPGAASAASSGAASGASGGATRGNVSPELLLQAKKLVDEMGGINKAKTAVDLLAELLG